MKAPFIEYKNFDIHFFRSFTIDAVVRQTGG